MRSEKTGKIAWMHTENGRKPEAKEVVGKAECLQQGKFYGMIDFAAGNFYNKTTSAIKAAIF